MKLGIYVQTWHVGGVATFCARLAQGLNGLGHSTSLILSTPHGKRDASGRDAYQQLLRDHVCPVICLHLNAYHPKERAWRAAEAIAGLACDGLILSAHRPLADAWAGLSRQAAILGVAHNDDPDTYAEFLACERFCDAYVAVSSAILEELQKLSPSANIERIPYGVPTPTTLAAPDSPIAQILVVCRLGQAQKRVLDLPRLWSEYRRLGGTASLTICGPGVEEVHLRQGFGEELRQGKVALLGAVPSGQMSAIYARHDILLSVSAYEGLPFVVLEGAAQGLFPVLSDIRSGHREILEALGHGQLCPVGDTSAFAAALCRITERVERLRVLRAEIQAAARSHFGLERMATHYAQLMEAVCRRRGRVERAVGRQSHAAKPRVDLLRRFIRKWQYSRHYGWQK